MVLQKSLKAGDLQDSCSYIQFLKTSFPSLTKKAPQLFSELPKSKDLSWETFLFQAFTTMFLSSDLLLVSISITICQSITIANRY